MKKVLHCPDRVLLEGRRILFLAGPNRFAPPWRLEGAIPYLEPRVPDDVLICSPERIDDHQSGPYSAQKKAEQMNWERDYLLGAVPNGIWLFWLPLASHSTDGHNYGQRTGHELALSAVLRSAEGLQVAIGAEKGYHGMASTMHTYRWFGDSSPTLYSSLIATCDATLDILCK